MGEQLTERKAALEILFCMLKDSEYMRMARHYFGFDDSVKCEYIFKKLFKRCWKLKPPIPHRYGGKKKKRSNINNKKKTMQKNKKRSKRKKPKKTKNTRCRKM